MTAYPGTPSGTNGRYIRRDRSVPSRFPTDRVAIVSLPFHAQLRRHHASRDSKILKTVPSIELVQASLYSQSIRNAGYAAARTQASAPDQDPTQTGACESATPGEPVRLRVVQHHAHAILAGIPERRAVHGPTDWVG